jgi:hypothetical protein
LKNPMSECSWGFLYLFVKYIIKREGLIKKVFIGIICKVS